ncbi:putative f-box domain-protein [Staphylotrichum tortipilum]|uniref:F-box domain-protein n=1 Tax=Staphylotrichum tortipilum TaxID=2831512 RepID=A0AAN6MD63_9PEZI|nr:putative f-box domain-protein [Staphylotrichum longicolle]
MASPPTSPFTASPTISPSSAAHTAVHEQLGRPLPASSKKGSRKRRPAAGLRKRPLALLDLPVDILQLIVTHTNDLAALAMTHSALYSLAIPHIYSRFDIVWPDAQPGPADLKSVDALTYGLSTLCVGSAFARTLAARSLSRPRRGSHRPHPCAALTNTDHAQYTRKFSLGNGPLDMVAEYDVDKESGKMLGTLVAAAVARMVNLESFVWDMPTGVLSRVFEALASLAHRPDSECKLTRVWIRWHDNSQQPDEPGVLDASGIANGTAALVPHGSQLTSVGILLPPNAAHPPPQPPVTYSEYHCQYPTFSVLPPLTSLSVLDIDEIGYLDEMAVLIERSKDSLQELRVGISAKAAGRPFAQAWDGPGLQQIDHRARWPGASTIGDRRLGGVLGILVGKIYDIPKRKPRDMPAVPAIPATLAGPGPGTNPLGVPSAWVMPVTTTMTPVTVPTAQVPVNDQSLALAEGAEPSSPTGSSAKLPARPKGKGSKQRKSATHTKKRLQGKLKLQTLALERVVLSLQVCRFAFDWSVLTSLTLLDCAQHDSFWKMLRKQFEPTRPDAAGTPAQYHLALRSIHTDSTTMSLMAFIKETLAPNSLETLLLQDRRTTTPPLPLDTVFKSALRRHAASLRKLLLDSSARLAGDNIRWRQWALTTEVLLYITSGRMKNLRELAVSIRYKDWHTFLQRLPQIPHLRALHIPHLADHPGAPCDPREIAHQLVDIAAVRPEVGLCYVGVASKCFEIYEACADRGGGGRGGGEETEEESEEGSGEEEEGEDATAGGDQDDDDDDDDDDDSDGDGDDGADGGDAGGGANTPPAGTSASEGGGDGEDEDDGFVEMGEGRATLRMREILFYDDKINVFKARHGRI